MTSVWNGCVAHAGFPALPAQKLGDFGLDESLIARIVDGIAGAMAVQ
jgi:hypothetical protein